MQSHANRPPALADLADMISPNLRPDELPRPLEALDARFRAPLMRFFLRRATNRADAEDLTQEVLLRAVSSSQGHAEHAPAFVFRIAINLLRDQRRKVVSRGASAFVPIEESLATEMERELMELRSPERILLSRQTLADALYALSELGDLTHDIFILFRIEKMKQREIAALYGIGVSTVEKHVMKAVAYLTAHFRA